MKRGVTLVEVSVVFALAVMLIIPVLTLSSRNAKEHEELLERSVAQGVCLDMLERLKSYKAFWPLPGSGSTASGMDAPPLKELFGPVELDVNKMTLFDRAYLEQLLVLGTTPLPRVIRTPDPTRAGLFRLEVSLAWTSSRGVPRLVRFVRYCFAP
jgi:hypothetical protein